MPSAQIAATIATAPASPTTKPSSSAGPSENPRSRKKLCRSCARSLNSAPSLAPSNAVEPIETTSSATVPATGASRAAPRDRHAQPTRPSSARPSGASEPISPNRTPNASALRDPGLDAVEAHPDQHHDEVDEHDDRERAGLGRARPAQLADREAEQAGGGREAAEPLRVLQRLGQRAATRAAIQPVARPSARHGLNSAKTSPKSSEANGTPTQKPT